MEPFYCHFSSPETPIEIKKIGLYFIFLLRAGEVGKEMYICARGRLQVVDTDGKTVLATLKAGSYFGEISILNMGTAGGKYFNGAEEYLF